jgi:DNA invertase Pin-like site-specific DNA recombinase
MNKIAYIYINPLLESSPDRDIWEVEIDRIYEDLGGRLSWQQLLEDCQIKPPKYLLIRRLEELGDSLIEISDRLNLIESLGVEVIAIEQDYRSSNLNNNNLKDFKLNLIKILEEVGKVQRSSKIKQGHARNRIKAIPPPGKAPYGYRRGKDKYAIDRSTSPVVKDFFERFLLFGSLRGAVRYLEKRYGKKISVSTGKSWLTNSIYRGDLCYKNGEVIRNTHLPIISREEAAQIDRLLRRNSLLPSRTASAPRSLAGLVVCRECSSSMKITKVTTKNKKQEYLYLRPTNCTRSKKCRAIAYQDVFNKTIEKICQDLLIAVSKLNMSNIGNVKEVLTQDIDRKQKILQQLSNLKEENILDEETANLRSYKLKTEISELENKIAQLPPMNLTSIANSVSIPQFWLDLSEVERRFYFREFIRQIEIIRSPDKAMDGRRCFQRKSFANDVSETVQSQDSNWNLGIVFIF